MHNSLKEVTCLIPSQMLKGTLEGCILKVISQKETYGYEISEKLREYGFADISEGTIYPLLLRLEKNGLIIAQYRESALGPKRKYFALSPSGKEEISIFYSNWIELEKAVDALFQNGGKENEQKDERA
jgi:PadR family transcriptional regulator, regulatory protein PadR